MNTMENIAMKYEEGGDNSMVDMDQNVSGSSSRQTRWERVRLPDDRWVLVPVEGE